MKYLPFSDSLSADARNREIAKRLGCGRNPEDVTVYWFSVIAKADPENADDKATDVAFMVPDDEWSLLDLKAPKDEQEILKPADAKALPVKPETIQALKTDAQLKSEGWLKEVKTTDLESPPIVAGVKLSSGWLWTNAIQPILKTFGA